VAATVSGMRSSDGTTVVGSGDGAAAAESSDRAARSGEPLFLSLRPQSSP
jgi:hypothetical protein